MEIDEILIKKKNLQSLILDFIENDDTDYDYLEKITRFITNSNITNNKQNLQDLLHMILNISNNHIRNSSFINKLIQIFLFILQDIQINFSDKDIYNIFKSNKLLILFLIENKIIIPSEELIRNIITKFRPGKLQYRYFLYPTIKKYINKNEQDEIEKEITERYEFDLNTFHQNCQKGENCRDVYAFF